MSSKKPSVGNITDKLEFSTPTPEVFAQALALKKERDACMDIDKLYEAIEKYTQAILLCPNDPYFLCARADIYAVLSRYDDAFNDCHTAIELDSEYPFTYGVLGLLFTFLERYKDAIDAYKKAVELYPEFEDFRVTLSFTEEKLKIVMQGSCPPSPEVIAKSIVLKEEGNDFMKASKFKDAIEKYTEAILLKRDPVYFCNRAAAYCGLKQYVSAQNDCLEALKLDDKYAKAHGRMAFTTSCLGDYFHAVQSYQKALDLDPDNKNYKENLALAKAKAREANQLP